MLVVEGMEDGFMIDCEALAGARCFRISRSSKSSETSLMSPSEGSLSDTSSMRACDMVATVWGGRDGGRGGVKMVGFSRLELWKRTRDEVGKGDGGVSRNTCSWLD